MQVSVRAKAEGETSKLIPSCVQAKEQEPCWSFDDEQTVRLRGGFQSGLLYEFLYEGKNPIILDLGFAITRDVVSFLRYQTADDSGTANPVRFNEKETGVKKVLALGISQSGRYLQEHIYSGFNQDERKRIVFDGLIADIGVRLCRRLDIGADPAVPQQVGGCPQDRPHQLGGRHRGGPGG